MPMRRMKGKKQKMWIKYFKGLAFCLSRKIMRDCARNFWERPRRKKRLRLTRVHPKKKHNKFQPFYGHQSLPQTSHGKQVARFAFEGGTRAHGAFAEWRNLRDAGCGSDDRKSH